jgi:hypothetical protein
MASMQAVLMALSAADSTNWGSRIQSVLDALDFMASSQEPANNPFTSEQCAIGARCTVHMCFDAASASMQPRLPSHVISSMCAACDAASAPRHCPLTVCTTNRVPRTTVAEVWDAVASVMSSVSQVSSNIDDMRAQLTSLSKNVSPHS